jgi:hypothetical protein
MIKQMFLIILAGFIAAIASLPCLAKTVPSDDLKVVIIRHGEKPETGDNLSCQGENRALQIPEVIKQKYGIPNFSYVPTLSLGSSTSHARMFQTITPFAIKYNLTINSSYGEKDTSKAAADVMKKTGTVLMVWEHSNIQALVISLGAKSAPSWPSGNDFDSIWVVTYQKGVVTLTTTDSEGITPSPDCSF